MVLKEEKDKVEIETHCITLKHFSILGVCVSIRNFPPSFQTFWKGCYTYRSMKFKRRDMFFLPLIFSICEAKKN
jgi:hypothetical protein